MPIEDIDIKETRLLRSDPDLMEKLLFDHTTRKNIIWATDMYEKYGEGYGFSDEITAVKITGEYEGIVKPRSVKSKEEQLVRTRDKAEVFTPSWVCNAQNNLVDEAWFGRKDVFNKEIINEDGSHTWIPTEGKIVFSDEKGKTWKDYVRDTRLEITCGEAPYLVSRYDTTTGESLPVEKRVGLLDRKLRVLSENEDDPEKWLEMVQEAFKNTYGYEWQGDSLLLARENLLFTFIDYYKAKFNRKPNARSLKYIAYIVSWNLWQMDGLKFVIPMSCHDEVHTSDGVQTDLFGGPVSAEPVSTVTPCPGCARDEMFYHNGIYAKVRDWGIWANNHKDKNGLTGKERCDIRFVDLMKKK